MGTPGTPGTGYPGYRVPGVPRCDWDAHVTHMNFKRCGVPPPESDTRTWSPDTTGYNRDHAVSKRRGRTTRVVFIAGQGTGYPGTR
eukprot:3681530-Rhodomonas_salina.1